MDTQLEPDFIPGPLGPSELSGTCNLFLQVMGKGQLQTGQQREAGILQPILCALSLLPEAWLQDTTVKSSPGSGQRRPWDPQAPIFTINPSI